MILLGMRILESEMKGLFTAVARSNFGASLLLSSHAAVISHEKHHHFHPAFNITSSTQLTVFSNTEAQPSMSCLSLQNF
jgi:hypothetical protein